MKIAAIVIAVVLTLALWTGWSWLDGSAGEDLHWSAGSVQADDEARADGEAADGESGPAADADAAGGPEPGTLAYYRKYVDRPGLQELATRLRAEVAERPDDGALHADLSEALRLLGELDDAVIHGTKAIELAPDSSQAHQRYAMALSLQGQAAGMLAAMAMKPKFEAAIAKAIELDPGNLDAVATRTAYLTFVPELFGGDKDEALRMARELQSVDATWGLLLEVINHGARDDLERALEVGMEALDRFPDNQRLLVTVGNVFEEMDRFPEALALWNRALDGARSQSWYLARWQRARLHLKRKTELEQVLGDLDTFFADDPYGDMLPKKAELHYRRGKALELLGRVDEAKQALRSALIEDPEHDHAAEDLERLGG